MTFLGRLSRLVIARTWWVALFWVVVTLVGMVTVGTAINRLSTTFSVPGKEGPRRRCDRRVAGFSDDRPVAIDR